MAVHQIGLGRTRIAVFLWIVTVGLEYVQVEEIGTGLIAAGMAQLVDLLLDLATDAGFGEVGTVAKTDEGIAPVLGLCRA